MFFSKSDFFFPFFFPPFFIIQAWFSYHFAGLPLTSCWAIGPPSVRGGGGSPQRPFSLLPLPELAVSILLSVVETLDS